MFHTFDYKESPKNLLTLIEKTKETYYEALQNSSIGWHDNTSDYTSFVRYYLGVVLKGYNDFQDRVEHLKYRKISKTERLKAVFEKKLGIIKAEFNLQMQQNSD